MRRDERQEAAPVRVPSSPRFFGLIRRAFAAGVLVLVAGALVIPAPLQGPADPGRVPNPVKSAWFLLWTQELVSYSKALVHLLVILLAVFVALPWLPGTRESRRARWLPPEQWPVTAFTLAAFAAILVLTLIAGLCRGENWVFTLPF